MEIKGGSDVSEKEIQKLALDYLLQHPLVSLVWQNDSRFTRSRKSGAVGKYRPKGLADVCGMFKGGRFFAIEFKKPGGKVTKEQAEFLQKVKDAGGLSLLAFSVEMVVEWLFSLGSLLRSI